MFVGEMGCWLVVGGFALYKRYLAPAAPMLHGGYRPVNRASVDGALDSEDDSSVLGRTQSAQEAASPAVKPLVPNADGRRPLVGWRVILLALPAICDIAGTTLMNVGLLFVAASIYQMTRGALVLFVGLFSVLFLRRKLHLYQWSALIVVVLGVGIVGLAGALAPNPQAKPDPNPALHLLRAAAQHATTTAQTPEALQTIIGVLLIAGAQIFTATQFVLEEYILEQYALEPLKVVGWEGVFGLSVTLLGMLVLHQAVGRTDAGRYGYFDAREGLREITSYRAIAVSSVLIMCSIGYVSFLFSSPSFRLYLPSKPIHPLHPQKLTSAPRPQRSGFNFFGLSVTRTVSATARSTIDTCRTLFIWLVSLALRWETFKWLQILGFALLVYGTFLFNDIVRPPLRVCLRGRGKDGEGGAGGRAERLLPEEPIEHV